MQYQKAYDYSMNGSPYGQRMNMNAVSDRYGHQAHQYYGRNGQMMMGMKSAVNFRQPISQREEATRPVPLISMHGVRNGFGYVILAAVCFVLGVMTIMNLVELNAAGKTLDDLRKGIVTTEEEIEQLQKSLVDKQNKVNVGAEAQKLGMVHVNSVETIYLTLPAVEHASLTDPVTVPGEHLASIQ